MIQVQSLKKTRTAYNIGVFIKSNVNGESFNGSGETLLARGMLKGVAHVTEGPLIGLEMFLSLAVVSSDS